MIEFLTAMMPYLGIIIAMIFLVTLSIIDLKTYSLKDGAIPAALTTTFIILTFLFIDYSQLAAGILAGILAILFIDLDIFAGVPDIKVMIACGLTLPNSLTVIVFAAIISVVALIYKFIVKKLNKDTIEIPFIPAIAISYIITIVILLV